MPTLPRLVPLALALALAACGAQQAGGNPDAGAKPPDAGSGAPDAGASTAPSLAITGPTANSEHELPTDADESFPVDFTVANFTLKPAGTCATTPNCGHVVIKVDGDACDWDGVGNNGSAVESPAYPGFRACPDSTGTHKVVLALVDDHAAAVNDDAGRPVSASVTVKMKENLTDPAVGITDPTGATPVTPDAETAAPITVAVERFTLKEAGACAGAAKCGHLHLFVDGDACSAGGSYNNVGVSPLKALFAKCGTPTGDHAVSVELHDDSHGLVKDQYDNVVSDTVFLTVAPPPAGG